MVHKLGLFLVKMFASLLLSSCEEQAYGSPLT